MTYSQSRIILLNNSHPLQWMMQSAKYSGPNAAPLGSLSPNEVNLEPSGGCRRLQVLLCGLEAASILLAIMACPGIDRRAVEDDTIDACVNLIKNHIQKHVAPALSNTGHMGMLSLTDDANGGDDGGGIVGEEDVPPKIKRAKTVAPNRGAVAKSLKVVYTPILSTIGLFGTILERAEEFINVNEMDDRLLFTLSSAALLSLTIDAAPIVRADVASLTSIVQESAMDLTAAIFGRYPRHRSIIIEDLFPLMLKLPTSKRSLRTFLIKKRLGAASTPMSAGGSNGENDYIQPICALTLLLIQASVVMPTQSGEEVVQEGDAKMDDGDESVDDEEDKPAPDTSGLDGCDAVCNQFTSQMLLRCSRKGEEGGASEFRPILSNLIDDLLQVRFMIEFPAADMLLLNLSHRLGNDLMRASTASKSHVVEATYLATAMDAFGKITSHVAGRLRQNREDPLNLSDNLCDVEPKEEVNRCFCGRGNLDTFMVDCDRCHFWYHGSCVTITKDNVPDQWFCDDCKLQTAILDQSKVFGRSHDGLEALTSKDHNHVFRQVLLGYLSNIAQSSSSIPAEKTRQFLIASWVRDISRMQNSDGNGSFDIELVRTHVISQWSSPSQQQQSYSYMHLTDHGLSKVMTALMATSQLSISFGQLLGVLLKLMGDDMTALRKLSLKAFLQVATADPALMSNPSVRKEVSRCFHDPAISVREAAIGLVGDYVLQSPHLAVAFHSPLLERLADKGISVRKRVVKIFRDILLSNPSYGGRAMAMHFMLKRADDRKEDDGVRDLIYETFHTLWFNGKAFEMGKSSLLLSNDPKQEDSNKSVAIITKAQLYCREAAKQMVDVVKLSGNSEFLTSLVNGLLFGFNEGDKDKKAAERKLRQEDSRNQCNNLVLALVELLLSFEETRTHKEDDGKELVALLSVLSVYSQAYPELIVPHIDTLVPYLKGDNGVKKFEQAIVGTVSAIVSQSSSHFSCAELSRLTGGGLPADLVNIAYKVRICCSMSCIISSPLSSFSNTVFSSHFITSPQFPPSAVSAAVEALAKLANHPDAKAGNTQEKKLHAMAVQFYSYLLKNKDGSGSDMKKFIRDNVRRALSALGSICRFYECHDACDSHNLDPNGFCVITDVKQLQFSGNVLSSACFALFRLYLEQDDESTKCLALRAMNGVFISRPRVVLVAEQLGIITYAISDAAPPSVQIESLRCWRDILLAEEKRIESGAAKVKLEAQKNVSVSKRISGDQDGDSCISGSVLTKHADRL